MRELQLTLARIHCIPDGGKSWKSQGAIPGSGCGRGKELCPARSQGSAGGAERRCGPRGAAPRGCHRPRTCGKLRHRAAQSRGGERGTRRPGRGRRRGTRRFRSSPGLGSGTGSGGAPRASYAVFPGPAALSRQAGQTDRQVQGQRCE